MAKFGRSVVEALSKHHVTDGALAKRRQTFNKTSLFGHIFPQHEYIDGSSTNNSDKEAIKKKIEAMKFNYISSTNLSMYNFQEIQVENDVLVKDLAENMKITIKKI